MEGGAQRDVEVLWTSGAARGVGSGVTMSRAEILSDAAPFFGRREGRPLRTREIVTTSLTSPDSPVPDEGGGVRNPSPTHPAAHPATHPAGARFSTFVIPESPANGHVDVVLLLLEWGADVMVQTHDGKTALYWAQLMGRYDVSRLLLKHHGHGGPRKTIKKTRIKKQTRPRRPS